MTPDTWKNAEMNLSLLELEEEKAKQKKENGGKNLPKKSTHLSNGWPRKNEKPSKNAWLSEAITPEEKNQ